MKHQTVNQKDVHRPASKRPYEAPKATFVPVKLEERVGGGCNAFILCK